MNRETLLELIKETLNSYSCLMLDCASLDEIIKGVQSHIHPDDLHEYGLEKNPHITVLYGIHTNDVEEVKSVLSLKPISFKLSGLSLFKNDEYDVLKFSIVSSDLHALNAQCKENLKYTSTYDTYVPHLTVAYIKKGRGEYYLNTLRDNTKVAFQSDTYIFSLSSGEKTTWSVK